MSRHVAKRSPYASRNTNHVARTVHRGTEALQSFFCRPGVLSMKIMARDQGLDSFPASACEVKILAASDRLVRARSLQGFPAISHDFPAFPRYPPHASSAPDAKQSSGRASSVAEPDVSRLYDPHLDGGGASLHRRGRLRRGLLLPDSVILRSHIQRVTRTRWRFEACIALSFPSKSCKPVIDETRNTVFLVHGVLKPFSLVFSAPVC